MEKSVNASTIITPEKAEHVLSNLRKQFHRALAEFNKSSSRKERLKKIQKSAQGLLKTLDLLDVKGADAVLTVLIFLKTLDASQLANSNRMILPNSLGQRRRVGITGVLKASLT